MCGALIIDHVLCCVSPSAPYPNPGEGGHTALSRVCRWEAQATGTGSLAHLLHSPHPAHYTEPRKAQRSARTVQSSPRSPHPAADPRCSRCSHSRGLKNTNQPATLPFSSFVSPPARFEVFFSSASGLSSPFFCYQGNDCFSRTYPLPLVRVSKSKGENLIQAGPGGSRS